MRRKRRDEPGATQTLQALQMFQNLLAGLDTAAVQRLVESREVMAALADGRLTPKKALASLGLPVILGNGKGVTMDFFGLPKDARREDALDAFRRQGLRPASNAEYARFSAQHPDVLHDIIVRSGRSLVVMGEKVRASSWRPRGSYWAYAIYSRDGDGAIVRYDEGIDGAWDTTHRFLGVRLDERPEAAIVPSVSLSHVSPKVRPMA